MIASNHDGGVPGSEKGRRREVFMNLRFLAILCAAGLAVPAAGAATRLAGSWAGTSGVEVSSAPGRILVSAVGPSGSLRARSESPAGGPSIPSVLSTGAGSGTTQGAPSVRTALVGIYPNPFNPTARIRYTLAARAHVRLRIYGIRGELVKTLVDRVEEPGPDHVVIWDGSTDAGGQAPSGLYFCNLAAPTPRGTEKLILVR
jgi:hypothetical protein